MDYNNHRVLSYTALSYFLSSMGDVFHNQKVLLYFPFYFGGKNIRLNDCACLDTSRFLRSVS